ncbi:MAG: phytanoyl-CoA dioxygenase family protein [Chloroflexota bacterium]|nr:phytanoyl-CoA dioxygenase family protein [Chloroflexota bacterium]
MTTPLQQEYDEKGYVIVRNAIDADLARETAEHLHWLAERNPGLRPEKFGHNMLVTDPFMHRLVGDERLVDIVEQFIGSDVAMWAAHYIAKPPKHGQRVLWHQDGSYWPLEPMEVTTIWLAATASTRENGCLRVLPGTQNNRLLSRREMIDVKDGKNVLESGIHPSQIDDSHVVDLELQPGDVSVHNPQIIHGSEPNTSDAWRIGLTLRYIPTSTRIKREGDRAILVRGQPDAGNDNIYAERPVFDPAAHMPFQGQEDWMPA